MTGNEIIKTMQQCNGWNGRCLNCPLNSEGTNCKEKLNSYALELINRQKTEIEGLKKELTEYKLQLKMSERTVDEIKSAAIKKFVHRLKDKVVQKYEYTDIRIFEEIDNLVKEIKRGVDSEYKAY